MAENGLEGSRPWWWCRRRLTGLPLRPPHGVRLQLHALTYDLGNFLRTLALPDEVRHCRNQPDVQYGSIPKA